MGFFSRKVKKGKVNREKSTLYLLRTKGVSKSIMVWRYWWEWVITVKVEEKYIQIIPNIDLTLLKQEIRFVIKNLNLFFDILIFNIFIYILDILLIYFIFNLVLVLAKKNKFSIKKKYYFDVISNSYIVKIGIIEIYM